MTSWFHPCSKWDGGGGETYMKLSPPALGQDLPGCLHYYFLIYFITKGVCDYRLDSDCVALRSVGWVFECSTVAYIWGGSRVRPKEAVTNLDLTLGQFIYFPQTLLMLFSLKPHSLLCIKNIIAMITADLSINSCSPPQTSQLNYTLVQISEGCSSEIKDCLNYNPRWYWKCLFADPLTLVLSYHAIFIKVWKEIGETGDPYVIYVIWWELYK